MNFSESSIKNLIAPAFLALASLFLSAASAEAKAIVVVEKNANLGVVKGIVRDDKGKPISEAIVAIFRVGTSHLLKQVRSSNDGSFLAKIIPGTYTILAVAEGYNAATIAEVQVNRSTEINYGFNLERAGSGNTLPEKRADRNSSKWRIRAAQSRRSIYQNQEGEEPTDETRAGAASQERVEESIGFGAEEEVLKRQRQSAVETYFADSPNGTYAGLNFATLQPIGEDSEMIISGETGIGKAATQRIETTFKTRPRQNHQVRLTTSFIKLGANGDSDQTLGQISVQALDEWRLNSGLVLVLGFDYSRFVGAGDDSSFSPRFGVQYDLDAKTRLRAAYTVQNEEKDWSNALELEDETVFFRGQAANSPVAVEDEKPLMNKSRRFEFGVERVLDNNSSIEATAFFDAVNGRGVGLVSLPISALSSENLEPLTINQQGAAQGLRIAYNRRFNRIVSASAGYSFGRGQRFAPDAVTPSEFLQNSFFHTFVGRINTDFRTGTQVQTIFRFSPEATVFAIDPFQGRLTIFDPSLNILITQTLPTLGLPIHAEAVIDARNIFDYQTVVNGEQSGLKLGGQGRSVRGGISVRF